MTILDAYKNDFLLFLEAGYIATNQMDEDSAIKLFKAAEALDAKSPLIKIGFGYLALHKLELKQAKKLFNEVLQQDPNNEMAKTFLGIATCLTPKEMTQGEKLLEETKKSSNPEIQKLTKTALDFVDTFLKKEPSPVEGKKRENKK